MTDEGVFGVASLIVPFAGLSEVDHGAVLTSAAIVGFAGKPGGLGHRTTVGPSPTTLVTLDGKRRDGG